MLPRAAWRRILATCAVSKRFAGGSRDQFCCGGGVPFHSTVVSSPVAMFRSQPRPLNGMMSRERVGRPPWGLMLKRFGAWLTAAVIATVVFVAWAQNSPTFHSKAMVLEMSWKRGKDYYGPNFIHLESSCASNPEPGCFCAVDFTRTKSKEFADYVESFGNKKVPVKHDVSYDRDRQVVGAGLISVGVWPAERFDITERSLGAGTRAVPNQSRSGVLHNKAPADCFPISEK